MKGAVGREDGEFLLERCPRESDVSTPESLWKEDPLAESLPYTLGKRVMPLEVRGRTLADSIAPAKRSVREATLDDRQWAILRESEAGRSYEEIGRNRGISRQRVGALVLRGRKVAAYRRATGAVDRRLAKTGEVHPRSPRSDASRSYHPELVGRLGMLRL
jgi:DNA-binding CsgD family transcriptional regulator